MADELTAPYTINIQNLPYNTKESDLMKYFGEIGTVEHVRISYDQVTGRPKGYGFCEFSKEEDRQNAINNRNGADFHGKTIKVTVAKYEAYVPN